MKTKELSEIERDPIDGIFGTIRNDTLIKLLQAVRAVREGVDRGEISSPEVFEQLQYLQADLQERINALEALPRRPAPAPKKSRKAEPDEIFS